MHDICAARSAVLHCHVGHLHISALTRGPLWTPASPSPRGTHEMCAAARTNTRCRCAVTCARCAVSSLHAFLDELSSPPFLSPNLPLVTYVYVDNCVRSHKGSREREKKHTKLNSLLTIEDVMATPGPQTNRYLYRIYISYNLHFLHYPRVI